MVRVRIQVLSQKRRGLAPRSVVNREREREMSEPWDDWILTRDEPTAWCGFDWPTIAKSYVVFPQSIYEQCAQEAQSYITLNTGDLTLAKLVADKLRSIE